MPSEPAHLLDHNFHPLPKDLEKLLRKKRDLEEKLIPAKEDLAKKEITFKGVRTKRDNAEAVVHGIEYDLNMVAVAMNLQLTVTPEFADSIGLHTKQITIVQNHGEAVEK